MTSPCGRGDPMFIGIGTLVLILLIVVVIMLMRGRTI